MAITQTPNLPGRLGDPTRLLNSDSRADPRMVAVLASLELDGAPPPMPVNADSPNEAVLEYLAVAEAGYAMLFDALFNDLPPVEGVTSETQVITGVDGNDINLYIHRPTEVDGPIPAIVHTHGGGMVIMKAANTNYVRWRDELAATGMVVVGVEFRNGGGELGPYPFPAGLNDCASATQWVNANREALGISSLILSGESGGGNLAVATTLKAKRDGWLEAIDGVYAQCPYISNLYGTPPPELPSLYENDGYFLNGEMMDVLARAYDPSGENSQNPLAWPYFATTDDLAGLPPHVISVNELDPLRDEGLALYRKLLAAGVSTASRTVNGTCHGGDCLMPQAMPEVYNATINSIKAFADSVPTSIDI